MLAFGAVRVMTRWSVRRCILLATAARPSTAKSLVTDRCALLLSDHTTYLWTARNVPCLQPLRSKSKKAKSKPPAAQDEEEDEEEGEEEEAESQEYGDNERVAFVSSLRIDSIMKAGINMSKTKVLESFYDGSIRLNGQKVPKKSIQVSTELLCQTLAFASSC
ncbi:uncharacterized protein [Dermacentor andersoni]|uniref:uncharacterized protein isoform X2 n=1 Tax=Dermacentor andersoni TaxID=34620 RepID=UPI0024178865|nr:mitochondrial transcription rescue factor 1-like isoform X2 [Dermacentor andersoni]